MPVRGSLGARGWVFGTYCLLGLVTLTSACDLAPFAAPVAGTGGEQAGGNDASGGGFSERGGGGSGGDDDGLPCGVASDAGQLVSQKDFAAAGQEQLDAAFVANDGAAWLSLGYDQAFEIDGDTLEAPVGRDVVVLRVHDGLTTDLHRIHGAGDQRVEAMQYDGALHVLGSVHGAASGLSVDDVDYPGFADGDAFYLHILGDQVNLYRLTGELVEARGITIDDLGHAWLAGSFQGSLTLSGTPNAAGLQGVIQTVVGTGPGLNGFSARLAFGAEALTAFGPPPGEGTGADEARIAGVIPFSDEGEVIVFGDFRGRLALETAVYESEGESDLFLARVGASGAVEDRARYDGPGAAQASAILRTPSGVGIIVGTYSGDLGFLPPPEGDTGMFVARLKLRDLKRGGSRAFSAATGALAPLSLAPYPWGAGVIITGQLLGDSFPLLGDVAFNDDPTPDGFVLALANDLDDRYAWHVEATGAATVRSVGTAPCQPAAVVGSFDEGSAHARRLGTSDAPVPLSGASDIDAFMLRLSY